VISSGLVILIVFVIPRNVVIPRNEESVSSYVGKTNGLIYKPLHAKRFAVARTKKNTAFGGIN
jgi:hypothetical protein